LTQTIPFILIIIRTIDAIVANDWNKFRAILTLRKLQQQLQQLQHLRPESIIFQGLSLIIFDQRAKLEDI